MSNLVTVRRTLTVVLFITTMALGAGCAGSQQPPPDQPLKARRFENLERVAGLTEKSQKGMSYSERIPRSVFTRSARWPVGKALTICFDGGTQPLRTRILGVASEWLKYANLAFTNGPATADGNCDLARPSDIRIGFDEDGYWSVVGNTKADGHTMSLEGFATDPPLEPEFTKVVLHEFGHALGFQHEHQHPEGGCDTEFDWPTVYATLGAPPNKWPKPVVDFNLRALKDAVAYDVSVVDRKSIMHYTLDPWMFIKGIQSPCYVAETLTLSALDQQGASAQYPLHYTADNAAADAKAIEKIALTLPADAVDAKRFIRAVANNVRTIK